MIVRLQRSRPVVITALGIAQILGWGTSFYFPAVLAAPIVQDTGWPLGWVVGGVSIGLMVGGLVSPRVGDIIARIGGRPVLAASSVLFAAGLGLIGLAPWLQLYLFGWVVVGLAMGAGLYDAAFAALGQVYGREARGPITNLTLFGGFASTVCWPLSAFLEQAFGWRETCLIYAALHLAVALPLQLVLPAGMQGEESMRTAAEPHDGSARPVPNERLIFVLIAALLTIAAGVGSIIVVHLLAFLQARGADYATAVTIGTLFGPAQVGARVIERLFGRHYHPIWTMAATCVLMAVGLVLLGGNLAVPALAVVLYAAGYGISWVARGTLPLALFGPQRYPSLMGRLAFPSLVVQALAPAAGAWLIERAGIDATIKVLILFAMLNVGLIAMLLIVARRTRATA
ncbi:MAG TPA: MFS transporter [Xanthobacteraceae bacterium]|nr:MFS transporter [Xanthobacteraceae bacterium]